MRNKIAAVLLAVVSLLAFAPQAYATSSRLLGLGMNNWQIEDSANFWYNPARLKSVPDAAVMEMGNQATAGGVLTTGSQWGGFTKSIGESVFALYIRRPYGTGDFNNVADPILFPGLGGFITARNVEGVTAGLPDASNATLGFGTGGPFGTGASVLSITGAPALSRRLALPANYFDLFMAVPVGDLTLGGWINYAGNEPGEVNKDSYTSGGPATGTVTRERTSSELNLAFGTIMDLDMFSGSKLELMAQFNKPSYKLKYSEYATTGTYTNSKIDSDAKMGLGLSARFAFKTESDSTWAITAQMGSQNTSGKASRIDDSNLGNSVLEFNRQVSFKNTRSFYSGNVTWQNPFGKNLLIASVGAQMNSTNQTWTLTNSTAAEVNHDDYYKVDNFVIPVRVAVEMQPWKILALRGGIQKNIFATTKARYRDIDGTTVTSQSESQTAASEAAGTANGVGLSFGMGLKLTDSLLLDGIVRQTLYFNGPNIVGGNASGLFARLTLEYRFGLFDDKNKFSGKRK